MKLFNKIFYLLGSVYFAIVLIASTVIFVVSGTLLESLTESHRYAAYFTYHNPFFIILLWGFFINILISALRRWPFKIKHVPFLITHLGLLMILSGTLIKSYFGVQGSMGIMEGSGSSELFVADSYVLHVEKRDPQDPQQIVAHNYPLSRDIFGKLRPEIDKSLQFPELELQLAEYAPHSNEKIETWIKGNQGYIAGFPVFQVLEIEDSLELHPSSQIPLSGNTLWDIYAVRSHKTAEIAKQIYLQNLNVLITDTITKNVLFKGALKDISGALTFNNATVNLELFWDYPEALYFQVLIKHPSSNETIKIALEGKESLKTTSSKSYKGKSAISLDFERTPALVIFQDTYDDITLFAFDSFGRIHTETFRNQSLSSLISYDQGFGGYSVQAKLPLASSRSDCEKLAQKQLVEQLKNSSSAQLSPPLELLRRCDVENFAENCIQFLALWNDNGSWLFPANQALPVNLSALFKKMDWEKVSKNEKNTCFWLHSLAENLGDQDILSYLRQRGWPLLEQLQTLENDEQIHAALVQQVFSASSILPDAEISPEIYPSMFSAYLLAYGIHLRHILPTIPEESFVIESPLTFRHENAIPQKKLENNMPKVVLRVKKGEIGQWVTLSYDRFGQGLKQSILYGEYLIRFQPAFREIPYHVRLRNARQINYANTNQPYSYESDLLITDIVEDSVVEKTISMNNVHETSAGYRFYLSNISPGDESAVKRVQIVVNYDPAKYWLTYLGAVVMTLGIILLFWKSKNR